MSDINAPDPIGIEIKSVSGGLLYASTQMHIREALVEAVSKERDLGGADLRGAYLRGADLRGANLGGAYLGGADLRGAYLRGADLGGAYLRGAYLRGADLTGADLRGAYLTGAYLTGANLGDAWKQVADKLTEARQAMNDSGAHWIKGALRGRLDDGSPTYCAIGSVQAVAEGTVQTLAMWLLTGVCGGDIAVFNDHPGTTWEDVDRVFGVAIMHARRFAEREEAS